DNEIVTAAQNLYGIVSDQTIFEILNTVTGVDAEAELERLKEEADKKQSLPEPRLVGDASGQEEPTAEKP
ncbi:phage portal protein, partial [Streptococcus equi]